MKKLKIIFCVVVAMLASLCMFACGGEEPLPDPDPGVEQVEIAHHGRTISAEVFRPDTSKFPVAIFSHATTGIRTTLSLRRIT